MSTDTIYNTFWTVREFNQDRSIAVESLKANGLEGMIGSLSRRAAVDRAIKSLHDRRHKTGKRISEKVVETVNTIVWAVLEKEAGDEVNTVQYAQKTTIIMNKDTGEVSAKGTLTKEVMDAVTKYDSAFNDNDVRVILRKVIRKARGFSLRPTGGIYGLLSSGLPIIESAKKALSDMGVPVKIYIQRVYTDEGAKEIVTKSLNDEIDQRIEVILKRVDGIRHSAKAAAGQAEEICEIQELLETYQELISDADSYNVLSTKVMEAANKVALAMNGLDAKASASGGHSMTVGSIAEKVLIEAGKPMKAIEIFKSALVKGWITGDDTAKRASFNAGLNAVAKSSTSVKLIGRGTYSLNLK